MKTCLRISADDYSNIQQHLFPEDGKEAITFALCGRAQAENRLVFTIYELLAVPYDHCEREDDYLHWYTRDVLPLMNKAMDRHMAILRIHSHPGGWAHFSEADLNTDQDFFGNLMTGWCEDGLPHLSTIMLPDGKIIGRVYYADGSAQELDSVLVVGERIQMVQYEKEQEDVPPEEALRNIQAFGEGTYNTFKHLRIGIVGCSGTGCHIIEQLLRLQVGELVLVDPDVIEEKNLNRLVGAGKSDIGKSKVEFYKSYIERMQLGVKAFAFPYNLYQSDDARRTLSTCDILFGCVDSTSGRMLLNNLSTFYLIPYMDIGVSLNADGKGGVSYVGAQMDYLIPGKSSLISRRVIDVENARAELEKLFDPELYEQHQKEHYIHNVQVNRPAVISVNGFIAYLAVLNLIDRFTNYRNEPQYSNVRILLHEDEVIKSPESKYSEDAYLKKYCGRGDCTPFLNMSTLA